MVFFDSSSKILNCATMKLGFLIRGKLSEVMKRVVTLHVGKSKRSS